MTNSQTLSNSKQIHKAPLQPSDVENNAAGWPAPGNHQQTHKMEHGAKVLPAENCYLNKKN